MYHFPESVPLEQTVLLVGTTWTAPHSFRRTGRTYVEPDLTKASILHWGLYSYNVSPPPLVDPLFCPPSSAVPCFRRKQYCWREFRCAMDDDKTTVDQPQGRSIRTLSTRLCSDRDSRRAFLLYVYLCIPWSVYQLFEYQFTLSFHR